MDLNDEHGTYQRQLKAAELLRSGLYTASEVALEVGINDICYFNRMLKKYYNISPGKYKSNHMNTNAQLPTVK